jgi:phosphoesterase RecJ-like protein
MTDTGCFRYSNTDTYCHSIAIECLDKGVNTNLIYQKIYENSSKKRVSILGEMISNIGYDLEGEFAWSIVTNSVMKKYKATKNDLEGFADFIRSIEGVEVALVIYEADLKSCRINFRSKGRFTVNNIAKLFGGGGHAFASGAVVNKPLNEAKKEIINNTKNMIQEQMGTA